MGSFEDTMTDVARQALTPKGKINALQASSTKLKAALSFNSSNSIPKTHHNSNSTTPYAVVIHGDNNTQSYVNLNSALHHLHWHIRDKMANGEGNIGLVNIDMETFIDLRNPPNVPVFTILDSKTKYHLVKVQVKKKPDRDQSTPETVGHNSASNISENIELKPLFSAIDQDINLLESIFNKKRSRSPKS